MGGSVGVLHAVLPRHIDHIQLRSTVKTRCIMRLVIDTTRMGGCGSAMNDHTSTRWAEVRRPCSGWAVQPAAAKRPRSAFRNRLAEPLERISRIIAA